ncbi:MAG: conjugal transfer protein TraF [Pseudomonadales bacterium]|nr:conjugal transfer protein TraF [Pseudomonadales bacterium]
MSQFFIGCLFLVASGISFADSAGKPAERWLDRKGEGFFWYKEEAEPEEIEEVKKPEPKPAPVAKSKPESAPEGPPPLSSAWIRENMQHYLDAAIDNPTPENITVFLYIQRYAMDKSFAFMDASQDATVGHSMFDEINRRPTATFANRKLDDLATDNHKAVISDISQNTGLFFFMDGTENSVIQSSIIDMLTRNYEFDVVKIAIEQLPPELQDKDIKFDSGHAKQLGITTTPAIALLRPDGTFDVISQAPVSYTDLQKRILVGAKRLGVISEKDFNSTRPIANIDKTLYFDLKKVSQTSSVPIQAKDLIKAFNGGS